MIDKTLLIVIINIIFLGHGVVYIIIIPVFFCSAGGQTTNITANTLTVSDITDVIYLTSTDASAEVTGTYNSIVFMIVTGEC